MREVTISSKRVFEGKLLKIDSLEVSCDGDGRTIREVVRHPGAVAAIARKRDGRFVFVRQYRKAVERETLEIVAGLLEEDEDADECIVREVGEETGYRVVKTVRLGQVKSSPGYTEENVAIYYAELGEQDGILQQDDDEFVEVEDYSLEEVESMLASNGIEDAKTYAAWWLYCRAAEDGRL